jgi:hypothetical protein
MIKDENVFKFKDKEYLMFQGERISQEQAQCIHTTI